MTRRPPHPIDDGSRAQRVERARAELERRGLLRASTEPDPAVERDTGGRPRVRTSAPSPRGGIAVVGYRRTLPGDSTSDDPPRVRRPDGSWSEGGEPVGTPDPLDDPTEVSADPEAPRVGGGGASLWAEITAPGAEPIRVVHDRLVRLAVTEAQLACAIGVLVSLALLAGVGIASLVATLALLRSS